jgi:hypothetical protein
MNKNSLFIFLILFFALVLRIYNLGFDEVWYDEARSIATAEKTLSVINFYRFFSYKPLYFLVLKIWIFLGGVSLVYLRMLSVIFAIASVFFIYRLGIVLKDQQLGNISAFLLAISCFHIYHSQQIRYFTFMVMLIIISYYYFFNILVLPQKKFFIYNTLYNILIVLTYPIGILIFFFQAISVIFFKMRKLKKRLLYQWPTFLTIILWLSFSNKERLIRNTWWIPQPNFKSILEAFQTFTYGGPRYGLDDFWIKFQHPLVLYVFSFIFFCFFIFGALNLFKINRKMLYVLLIWLIGPISISYLFSIFFFPIFVIKHLIVALPAFLILTSFGISFLKKKIYTISFLIIIFILSIYPLHILYSKDYSISWGKATAFLKAKIVPEDIIIIAPVCQVNSFLYYFREHKREILKDVDTYGIIRNGNLLQSFKEGDNLIIGINQVQNKNRSYFFDDLKIKLELSKKNKTSNVWLLTDRWMGDEKEIVISYLAKSYRTILKKEFRGIEIYRFN